MLYYVKHERVFVKRGLCASIWMPGIIVKVRDDGTLDIDLDDGSQDFDLCESDVPKTIFGLMILLR